MQNEVSILARQCHAQYKVWGWGVKEESRENGGCSIEKMEQTIETGNYKSQETESL